MRKLTYQEVYEIFKENGYELLDKQYVNSNTKMNCVDGEGYKYCVSINNLKLSLSKFCNGNKYTDHNIDILLKLKGGKYSRVTSDIKSTRQQMDLIDNDGYMYRVSVSHVISGDLKLTTVGNGNYWSIHNINVYLKLINSTDILKSTEFINQNEPLLWECKDGHTFNTNWNNYYTKGFRCFTCKNENRKLTFKDCYNEVSKREGYELLDIDRYKNRDGNLIIKYKLRHECGHEYWCNKTTYDFGSACKVCMYKKNGLKRRQNESEIKESVENNGFEYLGSEFIKRGNKNIRYINIRHLKCGKENKMMLTSWNKGNRCTCSIGESKQLSFEEWDKRINNHPYGRFKLIDVYSKKRKDGRSESCLKLKCMNCGTISERFGSGWDNGCVYCFTSKGEFEIKKVLELHNIAFEQQKKYENLHGLGGRQLSYDFFVPEYNLLIEYQGEFHDGNASCQTEEALKTQTEHDKRKKDYALSNGIDLLEIWYWDFSNIEEILTKQFKIKGE